jgi:hypothetical protein
MKFVKDNWKQVAVGVITIVIGAIVVSQIMSVRQEEDGTIVHSIKGLKKAA